MKSIWPKKMRLKGAQWRWKEMLVNWMRCVCSVESYGSRRGVKVLSGESLIHGIAVPGLGEITKILYNVCLPAEGR